MEERRRRRNYPSDVLGASIKKLHQDKFEEPLYYLITEILYLFKTIIGKQFNRNRKVIDSRPCFFKWLCQTDHSPRKRKLFFIQHNALSKSER